MKTFVSAAILLMSAMVFAGTANAAGCIKGAIVGGVAGHFVGHGKLGAAAGCVIGHHRASKAQQRQDNAQSGSSDNGSR